MQFSNITSLLVSPIPSAIHYFKESSWKGRTVQIVVAASLIYFVTRLWKTSPGSSTLIKRASTFAPQKAKAEGGKLVSAKYADKAFVKALFTRIESSHKGEDIDEMVEKWKESDQSQMWEPRYRGIGIWLANHQSSIEKVVKDPRLLQKVLTDWKEIPEKLLKPQEGVDKREFCLEFKKWIGELKKFDQIRKDALKTILTTELNKLQERQFEKLEEYIQYLIPNERDDLRILGMKRGEVGGRGLVSMQDIEVLRIREFEPHVMTLRQLLCCMRFELDGGEISPELLGCFLDEIETFRQKISNAKLSPWIQGGAKAVLTQVDAILASCASGTLTLESSAKFIQSMEELEKWDRIKQQCFLRSYMLQANHANAWQNIFSQNILSLSEYSAFSNIENVNALYDLNNHVQHGHRAVSGR